MMRTLPRRGPALTSPLSTLLTLVSLAWIGRARADEVPDAPTADERSAPAAHISLPSPPAATPSDVQVGDPPVEVVCKAAVALALAEPERARGFVSRARLAGWLPEVRFRMYRRFARTEGLTFDDTGTSAVAPVDVNAVDDVRYEWRATWDLSRMVFNADELQAHFEALRMADVRRDIQSLVIRLYFERRRLVLANEPSGNRAVAPRGGMTGDRSDDRRSLRILEIEAQLDSVSGGAFSEGKPARRGDKNTGWKVAAP
jgi:hypothetical protein